MQVNILNLITSNSLITYLYLYILNVGICGHHTYLKSCHLKVFGELGDHANMF